MNKIIINGVSYSGKNIIVTLGKILVDNRDVTPGNEKIINISVEGNIENMNVDVCEKIKITGDVKGVSTVSGDVEITGVVYGNVETTSGDIECGNINGNVETTSGDVNCKNVTGNIRAISGDINYN